MANSVADHHDGDRPQTVRPESDVLTPATQLAAPSERRSRRATLVRGAVARPGQADASAAGFSRSGAPGSDSDRRQTRAQAQSRARPWRRQGVSTPPALPNAEAAPAASHEVPSHEAASVLTATEQWLMDQGMPGLVRQDQAPRNSFAMMTPKLGVLLVAEGLSVRNPDWPPLANLVAVLLGLSLLELVRRAIAWQRPTGAQLDHSAVAVFLLTPAILQLIFGGSIVRAGLMVLFNAAAVFIAELVSIGLWPILRWSCLRIGKQFRASLGLFARALPLLLISTTFLFMTNEVWQVVGLMPWTQLLTLVGLFLVLATAFVLTQLPEEVRRLAALRSPEEIVQLCRGTPVSLIAPRLARAAARPRGLHRAEQLNVAVLLGTTLLTQVALVSLLVNVFFLVFGLIVVSRDLAATWTGQTEAVVLWSVQSINQELALTTSLVRVAAFLAAFTSLYFAVSLVEDETYRREFFGQMVAEIRQALAVRLVYRVLCEHHAAGTEAAPARAPTISPPS